MLTLQIDGDKIVSQTKVEETMNSTTQDVSEPGEVRRVHQEQAQKTARSGNGVSPGSHVSAADFAANLTSGQFENLAAIHRAQIEALAKASRTLMEGLIAMNREAADFRHQRARTIVEDTSSMPSLADVGKILNFQITYVDRATQAYLEEATKLFDLGLKIAEESFAPLQESTSKAFREVLRNDE